MVIVENEEDEDQRALRLMREQIKQKFGGIIGLGEKIAAGNGILKKPKKFEEDGEDEEEYDVEEVSDY